MRASRILAPGSSKEKTLAALFPPSSADCIRALVPVSLEPLTRTTGVSAMAVRHSIRVALVAHDLKWTPRKVLDLMSGIEHFPGFG